MRVLITGGTGNLGSALVREAVNAGHVVRVMSRRPRPQPAANELEWAQGDLASGSGIVEAVAGADAIIHAASDPRQTAAVDVNGTRHLLEAARRNSISHLLYISIVGIDEIPYSYYRRKLETEALITSSGVPHSILRATQFHSLVDLLISMAARVPLLMPLPVAFKFQSVAERDVAARLVGQLTAGPGGRLDDFGGPEVLTLGEMAGTWMKVRGVRRKKLIRLPLPGALAAAIRAGKNRTPDTPRGHINWREWLAENSVNKYLQRQSLATRQALER
jgi:uncharacterized protein YbjT (DUF2867 family)